MVLIRLITIWAWAGLALSRYIVGRLYLTIRFIGHRDERRARVHALAGRLVTWLLSRLGATFVKIGQILSARPDLLPDHIIAELKTLQDRVPAFPTDKARRILREALGERASQLLDTMSETPIAAASVAQVYEARLDDGTRVAVKVRRPNIKRLVTLDLSILVFLARITHRLPFIRPLHIDALCRQFANAVAAQVDFPLEISNNQRFAENFQDLEHVSVPKIYPDMCADDVITMDYVVGRKIYDVVANPPVPRATLGRRFLDLYYHMAFGDLFLHADLHPGNILIDEQGHITLLDTGLVYEIPVHYAKKFLRVAIAMTTRDGRIIGEAYLEGIEMSDKTRAQALDEMDALGKQYLQMSFSELEIGVLLVDIMRTLRRNGIHLDAEWAGLMLSDLTFEGLAKMVDSEINIMEIAAPFVLKHAMKRQLLSMTDPVVMAAARVAQKVSRDATGAEL